MQEKILGFYSVNSLKFDTRTYEISRQSVIMYVCVLELSIDAFWATKHSEFEVIIFERSLNQ